VTQALVCDASVAVGWVHPGQATALSKAVLDAMADGAVVEVPALWPLELSNALLVLTRRGKLSDLERKVGLAWLRTLPIRIDHDAAGLAWSTLSETAATLNLSVYDATYLELARRRTLPLACSDGPLRKAARLSGVRIWT
jgi:predicted nucleic acid-binding protein